MTRAGALLFWLMAAAYAQTAPAKLLEGVTAQAEAFRREARNLVATETLAQRSYRIPEHAHFAIGKAAESLRAQMVKHEIESEYRIGALGKEESANLVELRSVLAKDGRTIRTEAAARKELQLAPSIGEAQVQKKFLKVFTDLGLLDVATNYGLMLLLFTREGMADLAIEPMGDRYFGAEEAFVFRWRQRKGGMQEMRDRQPVRHSMDGELWVRRLDGMPLRITSRVEYEEPKHSIREEATLEFVQSTAGCMAPLLTVHRHYVDDRLLTENFYSYARFRRFQVDTEIQYANPIQK